VQYPAAEEVVQCWQLS